MLDCHVLALYVLSPMSVKLLRRTEYRHWARILQITSGWRSVTTLCSRGLTTIITVMHCCRVSTWRTLSSSFSASLRSASSPVSIQTQSLAFLGVFVYATHARQAIAFERKPGFSLWRLRKWKWINDESEVIVTDFVTKAACGNALNFLNRIKLWISSSSSSTYSFIW